MVNEEQRKIIFPYNLIQFSIIHTSPPPYNNSSGDKLIFLIGDYYDIALLQNTWHMIERRKTRLVARGFQHIVGPNYKETFSHVIKSSTIRIILYIVLHCTFQLGGKTIGYK